MGEGGDDIIATCPGVSKQLIGGPGDDFLSANVASGRVDFVGGDGVDAGFLFAQSMGPFQDVTVTLDDQSNDGPAGGTSNWHSDVEDIFTGSGSDTITGSPGPNTIRSDASPTGYGFNSFGAGNDTIDPGGGSDHVYSAGGDDTIMARDGAPDAINCGSNGSSTSVPGLPPFDTDTVTADALDTFVSCENVQASDPPDRRAPVIEVRAPRSITARAFRKGLKLKLAADEPASYVAELRAKVKRRGGGLAFAGALGEATIGQGRLELGTGPRTLKLRASKKFAKAVRGRSLRLVVRLVASDAAGNVTSATRNVRVKRGSR